MDAQYVNSPSCSSGSCKYQELALGFMKNINSLASFMTQMIYGEDVKVRPWAREPATQTDDCVECDWIGNATWEFAMSIACCWVQGNSGTHAETTNPKLHCSHVANVNGMNKREQICMNCVSKIINLPHVLMNIFMRYGLIVSLSTNIYIPINSKISIMSLST